METRLSVKDLEELKKRVIFSLEKADNELLTDVPSLDFLDMKIVFRLAFKNEDNSLNVGLINNQLFKDLGLTEQEMYELAKVNTPRILPAVCQSVFQTIGKMLDLQLFEDGENSVAFNVPIFVLTNELMTHGANVILYKDVLNKIANKFNTDLYVIPCSINEILVHPVMEDMEITSLKSLINDVNSTELKPEEVLSDSLYYYDRETDKLRIA